MEFKDLLEFTGIDAKDPDEFKAKFQETFVKVSEATKHPELKTKFQGIIMGGQATKLKKMFSEMGVELEGDEFAQVKDKNEDLIKLGLEKIVKTKEQEIADLRAKQGSSNDEVIKQKEAEIERLRAKWADTDKLLKQTASDLETERTTFQQKFKQKDIEWNLGKTRQALKIKPKPSELELLGFEKAIETRLKFDMDDAGEFFVTNSKGERIPSKAKAGAFLSPSEAMQELANEMGLVETNPHGGNPAPRPVNNNQNQNQNPNQNQMGAGGIKLHPKAIKAAETNS